VRFFEVYMRIFFRARYTRAVVIARLRVRALATTSVFLIALGANAAAAQASQCPFNVDGNGTVADALRDGTVLARYARGERNAAALVAGTGANSATVLATIASNLDRLDIDGSGAFDEADAAAILRVLFGFNTATAATIPKGNFATRDTPAALTAYLDGGCSSTPLADLQRASKFLIQASFGPSFADINAFNALAEDPAIFGSSTRRKASSWINTQFDTPRSDRHWNDYKTYFDANCVPNLRCGTADNLPRQSFWKQAITAPDQLRQRVAFALSQILVVSSLGISNNGNELSVYLDLLNDNALGNYRSIIDGALRSHAMSLYLSNYRNDGSRLTPNENLAREMLQLFSIGLLQLNADGTPVTGNPPTFTETTVKGFARAFTGLSFDDRPRTRRCIVDSLETIPSWNWTPEFTCSPSSDTTVIADREGYQRPFIAYAGHHSAAPRTLLQYDPTLANAASPDLRCTPAKVSATQNVTSVPTVPGTYGTQVSADTAERLIDDAVTNIFCHPNVGPFIGKQLIRFFVTSTPSPAYVARVTAAFNDNGSGVRGDMKKVMRAILLDEEAIYGSELTPGERLKFGKLREPVLRLSHILRAFPRPTRNAPAFSGRYYIDGLATPEYGINQSPLQSPSVFNFFHPQFVPPGPVRRASATAPEFEITTTTAIAQTQNYLGKLVSQSTYALPYGDFGYFTVFSAPRCALFANPPVYDDCLFMDYSELVAKVGNTSDMLDYVNLVLLGGKLPASVKATYLSAVEERLSANYSGLTAEQIRVRKIERVRVVIWLAVHSPEFQVQY
jgi:uncharacterized protein (DUF1800 family)